MKIMPIVNNTSFNGLWEKTKETKSLSPDEFSTIDIYLDNRYHPFANESESSIARALASKTYQTSIPTDNEYVIQRAISKPVAVKKLSFTEGEFSAYKSFYEKNLPESMKKIEKELVDCNLSHYLNNKTISSIKRFLHKIRII